MKFPKISALIGHKTVVSNETDPANLFINRELSWLRFNLRVLEEAFDRRRPLLERVKFLAIFANNLDEFFMIRIAGLYRQLQAGAGNLSQDGLSPWEQLNNLNEELLPVLERSAALWSKALQPALWFKGIRLYHFERLNTAQRRHVRDYFAKAIFPALTPLAFDPGHPFPHISNLSLNLALVVSDPESGAERFARLKVPDTFPRLLPLPAPETAGCELVWLEEVIAANADLLFPGMRLDAVYPFRITRDADLTIEEDEASDLLATVQESVGLRQFGSAIRLEIHHGMPQRIRRLLLENLGLRPEQLYTFRCPLGLSSLMELTKLDRAELKDPPLVQRTPKFLQRPASIFPLIQERDLLLYHPYDSFQPVVELVREAASDPQVLAIKQTLYRVGPNSPIIDALLQARENGKQVAVLVELKARFDEENNINWAQALEQAGVHVVYGLVGLKTHAKMCLVVRREADGIRRYVHLGTGNYNTVTSKVYSDLSFFTCNPLFGADASNLFNALTGYARQPAYHKLILAPLALRDQLIRRIEREIAWHRQEGGGYLAFKMNGLVDPECIKALYRASQAGVRVELQVRSICCLRPGIAGISENIRVSSIVGRFLEHARIYCFGNGGAPEILLGSADLMPRNLDRRVELLFPVEDPVLKAAVQTILRIHLQDNQQARRLLANGCYERINPSGNDPVINSQQWLVERDWFQVPPAPLPGKPMKPATFVESGISS